MSTKDSRLQHFPVPFFAVVMGLSGFTLAWEKAHLLFGAPEAAGRFLSGLTAAIFIVLAILYMVKMVRFPGAVRQEFHHPLKLSFFPAVSISLILLGICTLHIAPTAAFWLWIVGAAAHLAFTLYVMGAWIHHEKFQIHHINPAWFIPVVGNILVPIAGVPLGFPEISWFFFSIGIVFWLVLLTIFFNRIIFHDPMPERLVPTFFILIAPPAVGFIAWFRLTGGLDDFGRVLYYAALFFTLLLATQIGKFAKLPFFLSWWAYSFPLAAMTVATMVMYQELQTPVFRGLSMLLLGVLTLVILMLVAKTLAAIFRHGICVEEG